MSHRKYIKYQGRLYVADIPGRSVVMEDDNDGDAQEREKLRKIDRATEDAKRSVKEQIDMLRRQFMELYGNLEKGLDY